MTRVTAPIHCQGTIYLPKYSFSVETGRRKFLGPVEFRHSFVKNGDAENPSEIGEKCRILGYLQPIGKQTVQVECGEVNTVRFKSCFNQQILVLVDYLFCYHGNECQHPAGFTFPQHLAIEMNAVDIYGKTLLQFPPDYVCSLLSALEPCFQIKNHYPPHGIRQRYGDASR